MPIYEYVCECGSALEALEPVGAQRTSCAELCRRPPKLTKPAIGQGLVERVMSAPGIRGDGHEAKEPTFNPVRRANRPGCEDCDSDG
jgi:hypothetical protein